STDYDTSDRLYFEPLTLEDVLEVYQQEGCVGAIVQFGGQTPLNLATALKKNGVNVIGTSPESIELDVDCISDGETSVVGGMLEHIEFAGVHSGDAAMVMPPHTLSPAMLATV